MRPRFDIWAADREAADLQPNGMRVLRSTDAGRFLAAVWNPKATKPTGDARYRSWYA